MLQQMSSPSSAQFGEVATLVRSLEGRVCGDASAEVFSDIAENTELPECKIKRNYNCTKCTFYTQNPRAYLVHTRDVHFERFKIYDCPHCVYASRHHQKLIRHIKMVHEGGCPAGALKMESAEPSAPFPAPAELVEPMERIEDWLEEVEDCEDDQIDVEECNDDVEIDVEGDKPPLDGSGEGMSKPKGKYFSCAKCNYVTHIRARYTKHVKYHSMPMIKCTMCDFRTPYKWNLDRHMKNHGGSGSFCCSMCNFTADIKQSLTVHEMNHHTSTAGQWALGRRRNRVGGSDMADVASSLITKEEEGSSDSRSSHSDMGLQYVDIEMVSCNSESNDATSDTAGRKEEEQSPQDEQGQHSPNSASSETKSQKHSRKIPRPLPKLIPLNSSTPNQSKSSSEPPAKKLKEANETSETENVKRAENLPLDITLIPVNNTAKETTGRKKNESFFDKLKERLLAETGEEGSLICKNCGFVSKCLSEHSVHEKNCTSHCNKPATNTLLAGLGSTRCQNCRHRCKSRADLHIHMQTCRKNDKAGDNHSKDYKNQSGNETTTSNQDNDVAPHPMENVVFVWNNINPDSTKFETPLDIKINDDSTLPENNINFDIEIVDDNEGMNLSPSQAAGKNVFKCPYCQFWAATASRFHVHIVGHLNKKPFECSLCKYKSNWRWDITKHIKLKSARDPEHNEAKVLMTDETGRRNYSKYTKFLAIPVLNEKGENEFHYIDQAGSMEGLMDGEDLLNDTNESINQSFDMQPLNLQTQHIDQKYDSFDDRNGESKKPKKTLWKCKKCNYKDSSKEALLDHVREHSEIESNAEQKKSENIQDPADLAYRCGHCNQLSNWKHVIQRHCRLKHDGIIKVITTVKPKPDPVPPFELSDACTKCPFKSSDRQILMAHVEQHQPSPTSIYKCYFCPFFVKSEDELLQHLELHGIADPEEYIANMAKANALKSKTPMGIPAQLSMPGHPSKRHKCTECPYGTNSKSQFMYHEQFHRLPADTPYKCPECNYSVSKRHLLHQHLRVHGIIPKKNESEADLEAATDSMNLESVPINLDEIPFVWVSAKNEFHKMYKCRYCSYVNSQKCKIPIHEKIHCITFDNSEITIYKCLECKFTCDNALRLAEHAKAHGELYGRIYWPIEQDVPDEEQIAKLRKVLENEKNHCDGFADTDGSEKDLNVSEVHTFHNKSNHKKSSNTKHVPKQYYCKECPAKFFKSSALNYHAGLHNGDGEHKCKKCSYAVKNLGNLAKHELLHDNDGKQSCDYESGDDADFKNIPLSGTDLFQRKTEAQKRVLTDKDKLVKPNDHFPPVLQADPQFGYLMHGSPEFIYPTYLKNGRQKEKRYKCHKCPSAFEKREQYKIHLSLHGSKQRYKCELCDYSVKYYANYVQHMRKHQMNDEAQAERRKEADGFPESGTTEDKQEDSRENIKLAIKTMPRGVPRSDFQQFSISDQQTLRLLQRKRSMKNLGKDANQSETSPTKDRKLHMCLLCPYTNQRQDALTNHYRRHDESDALNTANNKCSHCDLVVVQSHFLREHMKTHFHYQKNLTPECFAANEGVTFTITDVEDDNVSTDLKIDMEHKNLNCNSDKVFVKIQTGEILVE